MKILITGCLGNVGRIACQGFLEAGHQVVGMDIRETCPIEGVEYHNSSVLDYEVLKTAMTGCDTVLHLAAYGHPFMAREQVVFDLNVRGTFHVFKACQELGIRRLTVASSINAIGYNFGIRVADMDHLPVSTDHPLYTTDIYSFSKENIEMMGQYFYRRYGISSVFMRFGLDFPYSIEEWMENEQFVGDVRSLHKLLKELMALPPKEAAREVRRIENEMDASRERSFGIPYDNDTEYVYAQFTNDQRIWSYYIHNFAMFLDRRDMAKAFLCSATSEFEGSHPVYIADHKNMLGIPTAQIAELCYPGAAVHYDLLPGYTSLVDTRAAEELIGFRAEHSFEDYYQHLFGEE